MNTVHAFTTTERSASPNAPLCQPFRWIDSTPPTMGDALRLVRIAELVRDLAPGLAVMVELLETDELSADRGERRLFNIVQRGSLLRMAAAVAHQIAADSEQLTEVACDFAEKENQQ